MRKRHKKRRNKNGKQEKGRDGDAPPTGNSSPTQAANSAQVPRLPSARLDLAPAPPTPARAAGVGAPPTLGPQALRQRPRSPVRPPETVSVTADGETWLARVVGSAQARGGVHLIEVEFAREQPEHSVRGLVAGSDLATVPQDDLEQALQRALPGADQAQGTE